MATSRLVAAVVERQCSHAQSPEAGWGGAPRFSASCMHREGGDASTRDCCTLTVSNSVEGSQDKVLNVMMAMTIKPMFMVRY
ncbi:unnamed protein product [Miscanthus lutarioriparius]|uniref:Uncharacterized protein n=1 Tax=Miscanthus lutarioriparius TaxID=422564 RepID=A0A811QR46_9POAL|nr:unnamed protein product [Miscanthus lutarioriparius]